MNNNLFNKVEKKTNVKKNDIINLAKSIQNKNMSDENNLRDLIHTIATMAGKEVDKEKEDKIVNAVKNNQINDEIKKMNNNL
ncbi:MAG: stage VI sporulation protein F [Erysipelotrichaceae bacterium]|mgnify:FL=1|nr:stage VI sporulation protein F [Erysipelotrichaceae bacterium]